MNTDIIIIPSDIDPKYNIAIIFKENRLYEEIKNKLESIEPGNIAMSIIGNDMIVFDGEAIYDINIDEFKAIEAHEVSHLILEHDNTNDIKSQEIEADIVAIDILISANLNNSAILLIERIKQLYSIEYDNNLLYSLLSPKSQELYNNFKTNLITT